MAVAAMTTRRSRELETPATVMSAATTRDTAERSHVLPQSLDRDRREMSTESIRKGQSIQRMMSATMKMIATVKSQRAESQDILSQRNLIED